MTRADDLALGDVWQDVVYTQTISDMIAAGFWCDRAASTSRWTTST